VPVASGVWGPMIAWATIAAEGGLAIATVAAAHAPPRRADRRADARDLHPRSPSGHTLGRRPRRDPQPGAGRRLPRVLRTRRLARTGARSHSLTSRQPASPDQNERLMLIAAGPSTTTNSAGKMQNTMG